MTFAVQLFAILGILCLPVISIAALVIVLAVLNMTLGVRRFYVKILTFLFDYATKIKKDKEIAIDADFLSTELSTPRSESHCADSSIDSAIELSPLDAIKKEDDIAQNSRISRASSQSDIQFRFSKISLVSANI